MIPASATECTCDRCGAEFYIGRANPQRPDDYLMPEYCPACGANRSLSGSTITAETQGADPSRAVDLDAECLICGKALKEHSIEGIKGCARKQRDTKLKDVRCPICNKPVLEHSHNENAACAARQREQQQREPGV